MKYEINNAGSKIFVVFLHAWFDRRSFLADLWISQRWSCVGEEIWWHWEVPIYLQTWVPM